MKKLIVLVAALCYTSVLFAQNTLPIAIKDAETHKPIVGATAVILGIAIGGATDTAGNVTLNKIPNGRQILKSSYIGYEARQDTLIFPLEQSGQLTILLKAEEGNELEAVTIGATRSSRTIAAIPTRVEVISGEELDEKGNMKPGDIRMLLAESTGIQTQQTSATSANSSIRIQGLDGRYTQLIRDGFPLYSGFSGGLGLLQIAPLDLKQVEVIKGSSSTLYGGGAIAGLVNLVSKTPTNKRRLDMLLNGTSAHGLDASIFYAEKYKKTGATVYAAYNHGSPYDPAGIGLSAIPRYNRYTINPKLFFYIDSGTTFSAGINATLENRTGGDMNYLKGFGRSDSYFEKNETGRYSTQLTFERQFNPHEKLVVKNSLGLFNRNINLRDYRFAGKQTSTYTEATYSHVGHAADWVAGVNYQTDNFREHAPPASMQQSYTGLRNYSFATLGGFVQNTWDASPQFTLETGLRGDYHNTHGFFLLPRLSALFKFNDHFSSRLGGGLGYKAPTVFTEDAERVVFRNVLPVDVNAIGPERSYGANYDLNYRTSLFDNQVSFSINQMFFYTRIENPVLFIPLANGNYQYQQPGGDLNTKGIETNLKLTYKDFKLFVGYTLADVAQHIGNTFSAYPLVSKHRINNVLMYEVEDKWKIGAEAYYFSGQTLNDSSAGRSYWTAGLMAEKLFERFSIFINFENLTDTRQTRFGTIYSGNISNPAFKDIYAPLDGFVINGGIKLKL